MTRETAGRPSDGVRTGRDALYRALQLLGYTNGYGSVDGTQDAELLRRGAVAVTQIAADLQRLEAPQREEALTDLDAPLPLSFHTRNDVLPYGVAMLIAQSESDGDSQGLYSLLYNRKRAGVDRPAAFRQDVLAGVGE